MADVTGTLRREHDGKTYALRLTPLGIAALQDEFGVDFIAKLGDGSTMPNMRLFVRIVQHALVKGEGMSLADAQALADDMLASEMGLPMRVMNAAFPQGEPGKNRAARRAKST